MLLLSWDSQGTEEAGAGRGGVGHRNRDKEVREEERKTGR